MELENVLPKISVEDIEIKYDRLELNRIGRGGCSQVFHIFYKENDAVLKKLNMQSTEKIKTEMLLEAQALNSLRHKNICHVFGICYDDVYQGIVLEYCAGSDLSVIMMRLNERKVHVETLTILKWCKVISSTMEFVSKTHVHGDLKPENVLVKERTCCCRKPIYEVHNFRGNDYNMCTHCHGINHEDITLKICDFGFSCHGTFGYMSKEAIVEGKRTESSDVYSFGVLIFFLVLGHPFPNMDAHEKALMTLNQQLDTSKCSSYSISEIIKECTVDDPLLRPSFHDLHSKLNCIIAEYSMLRTDKDSREIANKERNLLLHLYRNVDHANRITKEKESLNAAPKFVQRTSTQETCLSSESICESPVTISQDNHTYANDGYIAQSTPNSLSKASSYDLENDVILPTRKEKQTNVFTNTFNQCRNVMHRFRKNND